MQQRATCIKCEAKYVANVPVLLLLLAISPMPLGAGFYLIKGGFLPRLLVTGQAVGFCNASSNNLDRNRHYITLE